MLRDRGAVQQVDRRSVGLRSVTVKRGLLYLNNRRIKLAGASIHEDMPGSGAALTPADMDRIVADLKELGANVTRSHYLLNEGLLKRLDRAGIMVWNQAPIWQRDRKANVLREPLQRRRAWETVRRTVIAARSHPSVITHSVANELWSRPDDRPNVTRLYLERAQEIARDSDPTLPISVDINGRPYHPEQFTYHKFDMLGINQYFGWYRWVENFDDLPLYLQEMRDLYPDLALVMTEFGAEAPPGARQRPGQPSRAATPSRPSTSAARSTWPTPRRSRARSTGRCASSRSTPAGAAAPGSARRSSGPNTRHQKGLLTYEGEKKPAWYLARDRFKASPLYP